MVRVCGGGELVNREVGIMTLWVSDCDDFRKWRIRCSSAKKDDDPDTHRPFLGGWNL